MYVSVKVLSLKVQFNLTYQESQPGHSWHRAPETCRSFATLGSPLPSRPHKADQPEDSAFPSPPCHVPHHHHQHPSPPATALAAP